MSSLNARRTFGSGDTTRIQKLKLGGDLLLIVDENESTVEQARHLSQRLGCDLVDATDLSQLQAVLATRRPSVSFIALDRRAFNAAAVLRELSQCAPPPAVILLGDIDERLLSSARRLARTHGLTVVGALPRPFDPDAAEQLCTPYLDVPPPIPREELERALLEYELFLVYQPKMAIHTDGLRLQGVESFVRWKHPRRGLLRPRQLLESLEREDLLAALMNFVLQEAVRQAGQWRERGLALQVAVNLTPRLVRDHEFPDRLAALLREHEVPADCIAIDVTEDTQTDRALVLDVFTSLRLLGIGLTLDNFGTGFSSLTELCQMPFTEVKIDGSLIAEVPHEREPSIIVRAIVELAHTLGLKACAAGVERPATVEYLREIGCDALQGRVACEPTGAADIERFADRAGPERSAGAAGPGQR
jgi:EAL domain-containing protein (putative c-di-GMP-specific phosphodiesterase class I)